jgi:hypothetical protein
MLGSQKTTDARLPTTRKRTNNAPCISRRLPASLAHARAPVPVVWRPSPRAFARSSRALLTRLAVPSPAATLAAAPKPPRGGVGRGSQLARAEVGAPPVGGLDGSIAPESSSPSGGRASDGGGEDNGGAATCASAFGVAGSATTVAGSATTVADSGSGAAAAAAARLAAAGASCCSVGAGGVGGSAAREAAGALGRGSAGDGAFAASGALGGAGLTGVCAGLVGDILAEGGTAAAGGDAAVAGGDAAVAGGDAALAGGGGADCRGEGSLEGAGVGTASSTCGCDGDCGGGEEEADALARCCGGFGCGGGDGCCGFGCGCCGCGGCGFFGGDEGAVRLAAGARFPRPGSASPPVTLATAIGAGLKASLFHEAWPSGTMSSEASPSSPTPSRSETWLS